MLALPILGISSAVSEGGATATDGKIKSFVMTVNKVCSQSEEGNFESTRPTNSLPSSPLLRSIVLTFLGLFIFVVRLELSACSLVFVLIPMMRESGSMCALLVAHFHPGNSSTLTSANLIEI